MKNLIDAIEVYTEIQELIKLGLTDEDIAGYVCFFFTFDEMECTN